MFRGPCTSLSLSGPFARTRRAAGHAEAVAPAYPAGLSGRVSGAAKKNGGQVSSPGGRGAGSGMLQNAGAFLLPAGVFAGSMTTSEGSSRLARFYLCAIGAFLVVLGLVFTYWLFMAGEKAMITRHWTPTSCLILSSGTKEEQFSENSPVTWRTEFDYRYTFAGSVYHGTKLKRIEGPSPHREKAESAAAAYPAGMETTCYVNPAQPGEAVLEHSTKGAFYTLWWPMLFTVGGAGMIWSTLRGRKAAAGVVLKTP